MPLGGPGHPGGQSTTVVDILHEPTCPVLRGTISPAADTRRAAGRPRLAHIGPSAVHGDNQIAAPEHFPSTPHRVIRHPVMSGQVPLGAQTRAGPKLAGCYAGLLGTNVTPAIPRGKEHSTHEQHKRPSLPQTTRSARSWALS